MDSKHPTSSSSLLEKRNLEGAGEKRKKESEHWAPLRHSPVAKGKNKQVRVVGRMCFFELKKKKFRKKSRSSILSLGPRLELWGPLKRVFGGGKWPLSLKSSHVQGSNSKRIVPRKREVGGCDFPPGIKKEYLVLKAFEIAQ